MGLAAVPGREDDFLYGMKQAIEYAQAVKCPSIHIMAGNILTQREKLDERQRIRSEYRFLSFFVPLQNINYTNIIFNIIYIAWIKNGIAHLATATTTNFFWTQGILSCTLLVVMRFLLRSVMVNNLCKAVHLLDSAGIMGNLEPINTHISAPNYFLNLPEEAFSIIDEVESKTGKKRLVYQCDFFHLQVQQGNISRFLERNISKIGHFQVAQVPGRNEPDTDGELNYSFIFETIKK